MKRLFTTFFILLLTCITVSAQQADLRKTVASHFKGLNSFSATIKLTRHNAAITKDLVTKGNYYWKRPNMQSMVFKESKEMLLAIGNSYTMAKGGKQRTIKAKGMGNNPFEILSDIYTHLLSAEGNDALTSQANVSVSKQGTSYLLTVTPKAMNAKAKRRLMFTSFIITIDAKTGRMNRLLIHERGGNYSQYDFSGYVNNANINSRMFSTQAIKE